MATIEYTVFFDSKQADQTLLDKVDEVKVVQQVDQAWEARLKIPVAVNSDGKWDGEEETWMRPYNRVRVEVKVGDAAPVALIDGPVVGFEGERSAQPGKSIVTIVVHDDTAFLNRDDELALYQTGTDSDIAREIFSQANDIQGPIEIDPVPAQPDNPSSVVVQRGTKIQILRALAGRHRRWHAYVLPGPVAGQSVRAFKKFPAKPDGLPALFLLGPERNLSSFNATNNHSEPRDVTASTLSIKNKNIVTKTATYADAPLVGGEAANSQNTKRSTFRLPPGQNDAVDLDSAVQGEVDRASYSISATGSVIPFGYSSVLSPYRAVDVVISDSPYSSTYVITRVVHNLTRSVYTQEFSAISNSTSPDIGSSFVPGGVF
jgi:hypothetical protein